MPITSYTEEELRRIYLAQIRTNIPEADTSELGDYDMQARTLARVAASSQAHALSLSRQRFPADCDDSELPNHAAARGLGYLPPTKATGYIAIIGAVADVQPAGSLVSFADGRQYRTLADATVAASVFTTATIVQGSTRERLLLSSTTGLAVNSIITISTYTLIVKSIPASGIVDLLSPIPIIPFVGQIVTGVTGAVATIEASETGKRFNEPNTRTDMTIDTPFGSISATATSVMISGGSDAETSSELRQRIVDFDAGRPGGSNVEAIRTLAKAYTDARISEAFVYPNFGAPGRCLVVAYGPPYQRELATLTTDALEEFLLSAIGSEIDLVVQPISYTAAVDVSVTIRTGAGFEPDWGNSTTNTLTIAGGSTASRVNMTTSPVGLVPVGARVLVPVVLGASYRTEQRQVAGVDASGIDLAAPLSATPTTGGTVTSGSPLAQGVIDEVAELFDSLGPGTYVTGPNKDRFRWPNPATRFGAILGEAQVLSRVSQVEGTLDVAMTAALATTTPPALQTVRLGILTIRYVYA